MSPSNKLKNLVPFKDQKRSEDYFTYDFPKEVIGKLQAWQAWYEKILKIDAKFCLVIYEQMKIDVIKQLKSVVQFLGYDINKDLEHCILRNQEGDFHRPEKSNEEIEKIISRIPQKDLEAISVAKEHILKLLKNASSC